MRTFLIAIFAAASISTPVVALAQTAQQSCKQHCMLNSQACMRYASSAAQKNDCARQYQECQKSCR